MTDLHIEGSQVAHLLYLLLLFIHFFIAEVVNNILWGRQCGANRHNLLKEAVTTVADVDDSVNKVGAWLLDFIDNLASRFNRVQLHHIVSCLIEDR